MRHDNTLTLPGDIPGLLRRGSPIRIEEGESGVVLCPERRDAAFDSGVHHYEPWRLLLDITDATGRAHAAWWLAHKKAVHVDQPDPFAVSFAFYAKTIDTGVWAVWGRHHGACFAGGFTTHSHTFVHTLADLDPSDSRTLPDGSRWVDAEALRRVVLHVAGRG